MSSTYKLPIGGASVSDYSSQYSTTYAATKAIDKDTTTYWRCNTPTSAFITLQLAEAAIATRFRIYVGNSSYYATSWTLFGSNDGSSFTKITSGACSSTIGWQAFDFTNEATYTFYKWVCNTGNSSYLYTYEIELWKTVSYVKADGKYIGVEFSEEITTNIEAVLGYSFKEGAQDCTAYVSSQYSSYGAANLIDGSYSTKWVLYPIVANSYALFTLSSARVCMAVRMYLYATWYPKSFVVYGSSNGTDFVALGDTISVGTISANGYYDFTFANSDAYLYYKIVFLTHNSAETDIGEIWLSYPAGNERAFTVTGQVYNWVPNGELVSEEFKVAKVYAHPTVEKAVLLEIEDNDRFESAIGNLTIEYDKSLGNLAGYGGPVDSFSIALTPADLVWKGDQNDQEHVELTNVAITPNLIHVYYTGVKEDEAIELSSISVSGTLTHIDDL